MKILDKPEMTRWISFTLATLLLIGFGIFMHRFLASNFSDQGEAFMKGYGHILKENLSKGLFLVICLNLISATLLSFQFFLLLQREVQVIAYKLLRIAAFLLLILLIVYLIDKISTELTYTVAGNERLLEILVTWGLRITGFFLGYQLVKVVCTRTKD